MSDKDKTTGAPRSLDGLVRCPVCGRVARKYKDGYVGARVHWICSYASCHHVGEIKTPNSGISGKLSTYDRIKVSNKEKAKQPDTSGNHRKQ